MALLKFFKHCPPNRIEPTFNGRHWSDIEMQNCWNPCIPISNIVPKVAILTIFKPHLLPNGKSDWAKTWWEALGLYRDSALLKPFCYDIHEGFHSSHLEDLQLLGHLELWSRSLMLWSVDYCPSLISMSVGIFSHFWHLHQNHIHDGNHGSFLESL